MYKFESLKSQLKLCCKGDLNPEVSEINYAAESHWHEKGVPQQKKLGDPLTSHFEHGHYTLAQALESSNGLSFR